MIFLIPCRQMGGTRYRFRTVNFHLVFAYPSTTRRCRDSDTDSVVKQTGHTDIVTQNVELNFAKMMMAAVNPGDCYEGLNTARK